jgi:hypothetical protein
VEVSGNLGRCRKGKDVVEAESGRSDERTAQVHHLLCPNHRHAPFHLYHRQNLLSLYPVPSLCHPL